MAHGRDGTVTTSCLTSIRYGEAEGMANQSKWLSANPNYRLMTPAQRLFVSKAEGSLPIKGPLVAYHAVARPGQLVGNRLAGNQWMAFA